MKRVVLVTCVIIGAGLIFAFVQLTSTQSAEAQAPRQPAPAQSRPGQSTAQPRNQQLSQPRANQPAATRQDIRSSDAIQEAQTTREVSTTRPEQRLSDHDRGERFTADAAPASSPALTGQPDKGRLPGFDFVRDPLNALKPGQTFAEIMRADIAAKPNVMAEQKKLLESRYNLQPRLDREATMSRGKPLPVGPTARLRDGMTWDKLAGMSAQEIKSADAFPYPSLPHPKHTPGGQVFPQMQIKMFPRLERFDVDFDLPEAFLPEFPPAIFLQSRPELGDVSRGEVVSINNYYRLFKDIITPVQLDGLRLLLTPLPQEEFNPTDDRKSAQPSLGVTCLDCHVNGHTTGQFHLNPDDRPQQRRFRLDTTSLRGVSQQQIHGSKRSLRSVEDFTEFEQRTAYFNGDPIHAMKKGFMILDRVQVSHMAQMQNMFDFPPRRSWTTTAGWFRNKRLRAKRAAKSCSSARPAAANAIRRPFTWITRCTTCTRSGFWTSRRAGRSRRSPFAASRTALPTCMTGAA